VKWLALALVAAAAGSAAVAFVPRDEAAPAVAAGTASDPAHTPPAATRVVLVSAAMPAPSSPGTTLHAQLSKGRMPAAKTYGTVVTDSECTPGFDGVSRCRNEIRLSDGRTLVLRHPHDMANVPCLSPGERVLVAPA